jgi:rhodanese-related sulfurtransferase/DNA-binding HxlR family transcriptional regulator
VRGPDERKQRLLDQFAQVAKALANPKRLMLLDVLSQGERSVEALARATGLGTTTASAHLQGLRRGGLVTARRAGVRTYYRLAGDEVARLYVILRDVARAHLATAEREISEYLGEGDVEEVSRDELLGRVREGRSVVLDVRPAEEYALGHIAEAISIPVDELDERLGELPEGVEVIAYCRGAYCVFAHDAVCFLRTRGRNAHKLEGGMLEWRLAGMPIIIGDE